MPVMDLTNELSRRQTAATDQYLALVKQIASGEEVSPEDAETVLRDAGKTPDDLGPAVSDAKRRYELLREANTVGDLNRQLLGLQRAIDQRTKDFDAIQKQYRIDQQRLQAQLTETTQQLAAANQAAHDLRAEAPPERHQEYRDAREWHERTSRTVSELRDKVAQLQVVVNRKLSDDLASALNHHGGEVPSLAARQLEVDRTAAKKRIEGMNKELAEAEQKATAAHAAMREAEASLSAP